MKPMAKKKLNNRGKGPTGVNVGPVTKKYIVIPCDLKGDRIYHHRHHHREFVVHLL